MGKKKKAKKAKLKALKAELTKAQAELWCLVRGLPYTDEKGE